MLIYDFDVVLMWTIILSALISFFTVFSLSPLMKKFLERIEIVGTDQQKKGKPRMATSAGILVLSGVLMGTFFYIGVNTFLIRSPIGLTYILAALCSISIITFIGFMDDINISRSPRLSKGVNDFRIGLKQWQKPLLTLPAAIPLMAVIAGTSIMEIPFKGNTDFGIFYPLLLVPLAVVTVSNATNMLGGMNGMECGMGLVASLSLGIYTFTLGRMEASIISFTLALSLLAFLRWNWFPAKFLPGDSLTYLMGATIASVVIIGNVEKFGMFIFLPWVMEAFLKLRSGFSARSLGELQPNGKLKSPYSKVYSLTHLVMKTGLMKEWEISSVLILVEILVCALAFVLVA